MSKLLSVHKFLISASRFTKPLLMFQQQHFRLFTNLFPELGGLDCFAVEKAVGSESGKIVGETSLFPFVQKFSLLQFPTVVWFFEKPYAELSVGTHFVNYSQL